MPIEKKFASTLRRLRLSLAIAALLLAATLLCGARAAPETSLSAAMSAAVSQAPAAPGAIIVQDVVSGSILAARGLDVASHRLDRPGSTLKPFVLMALLDSGRLDPQQRILCRRTLTIGRTRMDCTHPANVSEIDAEATIAWSCNTYVSEVATRLTAQELVQTFRRAGFDSPTGLASNEATGTIPLAGNRWELQLEALGSWGIEITPLELLEAYRKLALRRREGNSGADAPVFAGLADSVAFGMAHAAFVADMRAAGKTGTASSADSARSHGFFVGYAPEDRPVVVVLVYLENGRGMDAAAAAQPIFAAYGKFRKP